MRSFVASVCLVSLVCVACAAASEQDCAPPAAVPSPPRASPVAGTPPAIPSKVTTGSPPLLRPHACPSAGYQPETQESEEATLTAFVNKNKGTAEAGKPSGHLEPAAIQRVVRSNYHEFRRCYEHGLVNNSNLRGQVTVRFVIERDGSVSKASLTYNSVPDCAVAECVVSKYPAMKFPEPEGGIVTVVYPITLEPG